MVDVSCERCTELLGDYVDDVLADDVRVALEAHVDSCPRCANLVQDYEAIPEMVRRVTDCGMPRQVEVRLQKLLAIARGRKP
jgi:anti-sigma factor RsiW